MTNPSDRFKIKEVLGIIGRIKTPKKARASRENGKLGGRPKSKRKILVKGGKN